MPLIINHLPTDIYPLIREFLPIDDFFCLLNTSKSVCQQIKRYHAYYKLTEKASLRFVNDREFRTNLLRLVEDPGRQIALQITDPEDEATVFDPTLTVHKIIYRTTKWSSYCIPYLPHVAEFESTKPASDISNGSHFLSLKIRLDNAITDISNLANVQNLSIHAGEELMASTFQSLGRQKQLVLFTCPGLTTCHHFSNIQSLTLFECRNLHDIRPLRGIRDLSILQCQQISDISCLGNHYKLKISWCAKVINGYHILRNIPIVHLNSCNISDLSVLQNAKEVNLTACHEIGDVTYLRDVPTVHLKGCNRITDISCLDGVRDLTVAHLPHLKTSITAMKEHCVFTKSSVEPDFPLHYTAIQKVVVWRSFTDTDVIQSLPSLRSIEVLYLDRNCCFRGARNVETVIIGWCKEQTSLEGLGNNRCIEIRHCPLITDVSCLSNVPMVKISYCSGITDYSCLREVPRLQIID